MKLVDADALMATVSRLKAFAEGVKNIPCKTGQMVSLDAIEQKIKAQPDASQPLRERVAELEAENQKLAEEIHEINERLRPIAILVKSVAEEKTRLERSMQKIKNCFISKKRLYTTPSKTLELIEAFVNEALKESDHA